MKVQILEGKIHTKVEIKVLGVRKSRVLRETEVQVETQYGPQWIRAGDSLSLDVTIDVHP